MRFFIGCARHLTLQFKVRPAEHRVTCKPIQVGGQSGGFRARGGGNHGQGWGNGLAIKLPDELVGPVR